MIVKNITGRPLPISEFGFVAQPNQEFDLPIPIAIRYKQYLLPIATPEAPQILPQNRTTKEARDSFLQSTNTFQVDPLANAAVTTVTVDNVTDMVKESVQDIVPEIAAEIHNDPIISALVNNPEIQESLTVIENIGQDEVSDLPESESDTDYDFESTTDVVEETNTTSKKKRK